MASALVVCLLPWHIIEYNHSNDAVSLYNNANRKCGIYYNNILIKCRITFFDLLFHETHAITQSIHTEMCIIFHLKIVFGPFISSFSSIVMIFIPSFENNDKHRINQSNAYVLFIFTIYKAKISICFWISNAITQAWSQSNLKC